VAERDNTSLRSQVVQLSEQIREHVSEAEGRFRVLAEHAPIGMFHVDLRTATIYRNPVMVDLLGLKASETLKGAGAHTELIHPDDRARAVAAMNDAFDTSKSVEIELRYCPADGKVVWILERSVPELDANGNRLGWIGTLVDITERKHAEQLAELERRIILQVSGNLARVPWARFFDCLCAELCASLNVDVVFLFEYEASPRPHFVATSGVYRGNELTRVCYPVEMAAVDHAENQTEWAMLGESFADPISADGWVPAGMQRRIVFPLLSSNGTLLGLLGLMHGGSFETDLTRRVLGLFALRASAELERQRNQRLLNEQRENLRWINALSSRVHGCSTLREIAAEGLHAIAGRTCAQWAGITIDSEDQPCWIVRPGGELIERPQRIIDRRAGVLKTLAASSGLLIVHDLQRAFADQPEALELVRSHRAVELVLVSLNHRGRDLGRLWIAFKESGQANLLDRETLRAIGKMLSLAISSAQYTADLEYRASHDALTGLYSRNVLYTQFASLARPEALLALLLLDLDRFKEINDALGHAVGDRLLQQIGPRMRGVLGNREHLLCRMGGDEFALLLPQLENADTLHTISKALLTALQQPFEIDSMRLQVGASIGIACYPYHGSDSHALLRSADVAMYAAKRGGGGTALYDAALDLHTPKRLSLMGGLPDAIREHQLCMHYQPKLDLHDGRITGFEALVRWQHPQFGLLGPDMFLPLAEMSDSIHALTAEVLRMACAEMAGWRAQGHDYTVAVNLSARNLADDQLYWLLKELISEHALPADALELEITETALMLEPDRAADLLTQIAQTGATIAIDDYGTGYSSLAYLRKLPIRALKIDRTFVQDMETDAQDAVIVQSTVQLAHNLGLSVVAEGVENEATLNQLRRIGCDQVQGFHISRALPWAQMRKWLQQEQQQRLFCQIAPQALTL
jgi:diguanylate cyclase (GGDEF)-like protein/PAS domain S-box-containing protein